MNSVSLVTPWILNCCSNALKKGTHVLCSFFHITRSAQRPLSRGWVVDDDDDDEWELEEIEGIVDACVSMVTRWVSLAAWRPTEKPHDGQLPIISTPAVCRTGMVKLHTWNEEEEKVAGEGDVRGLVRDGRAESFPSVSLLPVLVEEELDEFDDEWEGLWERLMIKGYREGKNGEKEKPLIDYRWIKRWMIKQSNTQVWIRSTQMKRDERYCTHTRLILRPTCKCIWDVMMYEEMSCVQTKGLCDEWNEQICECWETEKGRMIE